MEEEKQFVELPRSLIFLSALWLIGSFFLTMGARTPVQVSSASYTPSYRLMILCMIIGMMIAWPLFRLSQKVQPRPIIHTVLDIIVLLSLVQVILWPLRLITPWTPLRNAAIDATICGWLLLAGAIVASAIGVSKSGPRILAMLACLCLCLLGPVLGTIGFDIGFSNRELIELSPLMAVHTLTEGGGSQPTPIQWWWIALLGVAAISAWSALMILALISRYRLALHP